MEFQTTHNLPFEVAGFDMRIDNDHLWEKFRVGTCEGLWCSTDKSYCILAVINSSPGNGHLNDVFEWFEHSCKRDKRTLKVMELWNKNFKKHLIEKRGFVDIGCDNVEKVLPQ